MKKDNFLELVYNNVEENENYKQIIELVVDTCFTEENLNNLNLYISITLTTPEEIRKINNQFRNIDKETDVLSFPMFEKSEIDNMVKTEENEVVEALGDIIISLERVEQQAKEYGHSFERELAYMVVHGFYHLMGYDHMVDEDKIIMREKEENILKKLNINR